MTKAITYVFIFAVAVGLRLYWLEQKQGLHIDDLYSVRISNCQDNWIHVPETLLDGEEHSGLEIKRAFVEQPRGLIRCLYELRRDNRDHNHTNLYYSLLRIANHGNTSPSIGALKIRAGALNLCLFSVTFVLLTLLLRELFASHVLVALGLIVATWSSGGLANTVMFRPYELQAMALVAFALLLVKAWRSDLRPSRRQLWKCSGVVALAWLTVYPSFIFVAMACMALLVKHRRKALLPMLEVLLLASLIASTVYPNYFTGFVGGNRSNATHHLLNPTALWSLLTDAVAYLYRYLWHLPVLLVVVALLAWRWRKVQRSAVLLACLAAAWMLIVLHLAPGHNLRFIVAGMPLMSLMVPAVVKVLGRRLRIAATVLLGACFAAYALVPRVEEGHEEWVFPLAQRNFPKAKHIVYEMNEDAMWWFCWIALNVPDSTLVRLAPEPAVQGEATLMRYPGTDYYGFFEVREP